MSERANQLRRLQQLMERAANDPRVSPELRAEARRQARLLKQVYRVRQQRDFFDAALGTPKPAPGSFPSSRRPLVTLPIKLALSNGD